MRTFKVTVFLEVKVEEEGELKEAVRDALEDAIDAHDFEDEELEFGAEEIDDDF